MSWYQVSVTCAGERAPQIGELMERAGAVALSFADPRDADPRSAVLEPPPGLGPMWAVTRVQGLFAGDLADLDRLGRELSATLDAGGSSAVNQPPVEIEVVAERDWVSESRAHTEAMCFGSGLWVCPYGHPPGAGAHPIRTVVDMDPGVAFGTGAHPTTRLCLEWLAEQPLEGARVLDYGCGSGVLGIAAVLLGARHASMIDVDPQARGAAGANAVRNGVADRVVVAGPVAEDRASTATPHPAERFDAIVANILLEPLVELAPALAGCTVTGGSICMAGVLEDQTVALVRAYRPWFDVAAAAALDGWGSVCGTRRHRPRLLFRGRTVSSPTGS